MIHEFLVYGEGVVAVIATYKKVSSKFSELKKKRRLSCSLVERVVDNYSNRLPLGLR